MVDARKIFNEIRPYILGLVSTAGGGSGPYAPTPHDLNGLHHSGTLDPSQYPGALLADGSRNLTGNLGVTAGVTIDGVDLSALAAEYNAHLTGDSHTQYVHISTNRTITAQHQFAPASAQAPFTLGANAQGQPVIGLMADQLNRSVLAGNGLTGGGLLSVTRTLDVGAGTGISVSADAVAINLAAALTWTALQTFSAGISAANVQSDLVPNATDTYDLGSSLKLWRKGYLSEMDAVLFAENTITLLGGWFYVTKDAGTLAADVTAVANQINFGKAMTNGNFVVLRSSLQVEYIQVGTLVSGTTYNVTRNLDGSGANVWPSGQPFAVLGSSGDGRIELNAYDTPRMSILSQGATYNAQTELIRLGDLNGSFGIVTQRFGIGIGDYSGGNYFRYDPTNGFKISAGGGGVIINDDGIALNSIASFAYKALQFYRNDLANDIGHLQVLYSAVNDRTEVYLRGLNDNGSTGAYDHVRVTLGGDWHNGSTIVKGSTLYLHSGYLGGDYGYAEFNNTQAIIGNGAYLFETTAVYCFIYNDAAFIHNSSGNWLSVTFNSEIWDVHGFHSTSTNTSRIVIPSAGTFYNYEGLYHIWAGIEFNASSTGTRGLRILLDGIQVIAEKTINADTSYNTYMTITADWPLTAGEYVEIQVLQNTGGNLQINSNYAYSPQFRVIRWS